MRLAIGCDRRGEQAMRWLIALLKDLGHEVFDFNASHPDIMDYPDIALPVSLAVSRGQCQVGILLDGNGIGMPLVANKIPAVRAAAVHDEVAARFACLHARCNVLCIGCDLHSPRQIRAIVTSFLAGFTSRTIPTPIIETPAIEIPIPVEQIPPTILGAQ
jgi:ribose 5-phosphate isomerase B